MQPQPQEGYADLSVSIDLPSLGVQTRSLATDPKNAGGSWTTWEKFVDGALLYNVTLFVVNSDGVLVGYRDFYSGSADVKAEDSAYGGNGFYETSAVNTSAATGVAVKATFNAASPVHGAIEKLVPGVYKIYAVANYAPITADNSNLFAEGETAVTYAGLGNVAEDDGNNNGLGGSFADIVSTIKTNFNTTAGLSGFTQDEGSNGEAFLTYKLNSGTDRVCKQLPQPLVMVRNVTLVAGENKVTGLLSRTFARVRIEVKNNDTSSMIGVSGLSFQDNYASRNAYLFNDVAAGEGVNLYDDFALYESTKGAIVVTSADAIIPASSTMKRLPAGVSNTVLDCYILEGMISATYAFQFTATHWTSGTTGNATANYRITSFYASEGSSGYGLLDFMVYLRDSATANNATGSNYLLESTTTGQYAQTGTMTVTTPGEISEGTVLDPKYVWEIVLTSDPTYNSQVGVAPGNIHCVGSGLYLQPYDGSEDMTPKLADTPGELIFKINFNTMVENGTIFCLYNGTYYYLYSNNHKLTWVACGSTVTSITTSSPSSYQYLSFETIPGENGKQTDVTIQKSVTSSTTTETPTNEIARNDFFYGIVPVSISSSSASSTTTTTE